MLSGSPLKGWARTSFSTAVALMKREPWPGLPCAVTLNPAGHQLNVSK